MCIYFDSLHVSSNLVLIIRRVNCINRTSGVCHCVGDRPACRSGPTRPACQTVTYTEWHIPDVVLILLTLLMMSTVLLETLKESKQIYIKLIVRQVGYLLEFFMAVSTACSPHPQLPFISRGRLINRYSITSRYVMATASQVPRANES
jgi:hypothetical protein